MLKTHESLFKFEDEKKKKKPHKISFSNKELFVISYIV